VTAAATSAPQPARRRTGTYLLVLLIEALTIIALWTFGHYFGAP
jgi:hypothetical protein